MDMKGIVSFPADTKKSKVRLKWTKQLHERFIVVVSDLGGIDNATPKSIMQLMGVPGLTLYHLKSHLQKYRLARNREPNTLIENKTEECSKYNSMVEDNTPNYTKTFPCLHESKMLQMQMEVQRKIQEQIEVQRHLQVRIEAQGKYLQSVLKKAQETLAVYNANSFETVAPVFSTSVHSAGDCSNDSCLTSSEGKKDDKCKLEVGCSSVHHRSDDVNEIGRKRSFSSMCGEPCVEQPIGGKRRLLFFQEKHSSKGLEHLDLNN